MAFDPDDPRITAYALGALSAKGKEKFELELEQSEELRRAVEETGQALQRLGDELNNAPEVGLTDEQRNTVDDGTGSFDSRCHGGLRGGVE